MQAFFETSTSIFAFMIFVAILGRLTSGRFGDRIGKKVILVTCFLLMFLAVIVLAIAETITQAIIYIILYGLGDGARGPILIALSGELFGPNNFVPIISLSQPIMVISAFIEHIAAGFAYAVQGGYVTVFIIILPETY